MFKSVRGRITLLATTVVALALTAASLLIFWMVEADLVETTERALRAELELQANAFELQGVPPLIELQTIERDFGFGLFTEEEFAATGSVFDENGVPLADVLLDPDGLFVVDIFDPRTGIRVTDPELIAQLNALAFDAVEVDVDGGDSLVVGAVASDEVDASLRAVRNALLAIVPGLAILMGVLIWALVGRALRPVRAISDEVQAISTSNLDRRVPVPGGNDEISGLANVMNTMLGRLQRGDSRQRQFAADASHELRSPLATVRAAAEILERNPGSDRAPALAGDIVAEADRMDTLIGDLLYLSRVEEEVAAKSHLAVDLSALVSGFGEATSVEPNVVITGDARQLDRAITNLVDNAHRHAESNVRLCLGTMTYEGRPLAAIAVEDDGPGIEPGLRATIFERFSRLDKARSRDRGGAGLGLALVQAIVVRHRGGIVIDDSPTFGGARFTIHLPLLGSGETVEESS